MINKEPSWNKTIEQGPFRPADRELYVDAPAHSDNPPEIYEDALNFNLEQLHGKKVLDIGGMPGGQFADAVLWSGAELTTLNPLAPTEEELAKYGFVKGQKDKYTILKGYIQDLSAVPDNTYDIELGFAVLDKLPNFESEWRSALFEATRTLKADGVAIFTIEGDKIISTENIKKLFEDLRNLGTVNLVLRGVIRGIPIYNLIIKKSASDKI